MPVCPTPLSPDRSRCPAKTVAVCHPHAIHRYCHPMTLDSVWYKSTTNLDTEAGPGLVDREVG